METVLSLFPGIDLLGRAFEHVGYCVVRGPDLILDARIETFHAAPRHFDGIVGGPPCQNYSDANRRRNPAEGDRLVKHFARVVTEAWPAWWLMENVRNVPTVQIYPYHIQRLDITDAACGGKQRRLRHIQFGSLSANIIRPARTNGRRPVTPTVTCKNAGPHDRASRRKSRQGLDAETAPTLRLHSFTAAARARLIGNAVPWRMALALANAVRLQGPVTPADCACGCGRTITGQQHSATPACRKRLQRQLRGEGRILDCNPDTSLPPF